MSCSEELKGVVDSLSVRLQNCTMALYNVCDGVCDADIKVLCNESGATCSKVITISLVSHSIGKCIGGVRIE